MLAIIAIIMAVAILNGFKKEITDKQRGFFGDITVIKNELGSSFEHTPIHLSKEEIQQLSTVPNVTGIGAFATKAGIIHVNNEVEGVLLKGLGKNYRQDYLKKMIVEGDTLDFSADNADQQVLISETTARRLLLKPGDSFIIYFVQEPIRKRKLTISGIYTSNSEELDKTYIIGSLSLIQRLNGLTEEEVGGYEVRVKDFQQLAETSLDVDYLLPPHMIATNVIEQMPDVFNWLDLLDMNDNIIFVLMIVVAVINLVSALLISILERSSMVGILKALGMSNGRIRRVFIYNSAYLIGIGLILGNVCAAALYYFQAYTHFLKLDPTIYYLSFVPVQISFLEVLTLNIGLVTVVLLTLLLPSMLISRISPIKTIQFK